LTSVGALSSASLNRALLMQKSTGGRLGTVLLEHHLVTEDTLARALAKLTGHEYAYWTAVESTPREVINIVPPKIAIRYGAIPFDREGRILKVAMRDPNDLAAADEISFVTGKKIETFVLSEVRIAEALEKFYGERRLPRFRTLSEKLARGVPVTTPAAPPPPPPALYGTTPPPSGAPPSMPPKRSTSEIWKVPAGISGAEDIDIATWRPETATRPGSVAPKPEPLEIDYTPEDLEEPPPPPPPPPPAPVPISLEEAGRRILSADAREDIADAALDHLAGFGFSRYALFIARKDDVIGWSARGEGVSRNAFKALQIPFSTPSIFLNTRLSGTFFQGALPPLPAHGRLLEALGGEPRHCGIMPVTLKKRVVAFLYVESPEPVILPRIVDALAKLASAMADGFARLILQRRSREESA
jgi:Type II secretion system (T2SS), protein E, N-terminal domain